MMDMQRLSMVRLKQSLILLFIMDNYSIIRSEYKILLCSCSIMFCFSFLFSLSYLFNPFKLVSCVGSFFLSLSVFELLLPLLRKVEEILIAVAP